MKRTIGIFGFGFIGKAIAHGMYLHFNLKIYDKYDNVHDSIEDTVNMSEVIFVGVPTPMNDDGSQDLSNLDDAIQSIVNIAITRKIIILKSTIIPGTTRKYSEKYPNHSFIFNPEFLTERQAKLDFLNPARIILGGDHQYTLDIVKDIYRTRFPHTQIFLTSWEAAEITKYMCNCFFAIKVAFLNEIYDVAKNQDIDYNELVNLWLSDQRIGNSHTDVPGHDGLRGFGGKCFPKDVMAFINWSEDLGLNADVCRSAIDVNERVREEKDWENILGATSNNNYKGD